LADRVLPVLGERPVRALTRSDVESWMQWAERQTAPGSGRSYAQDTLRSWWRVLGTMLRDAAADVGISDPTTRVRPPRGSVRSVRERGTLTVEELGRFVETARTRWADWYAEVYVLAYSGMRPGELYALYWEDADFERGCIHVRRAVWRGQEGTTKTDDPREVAMPEPMREVLRAHRQQQLLREPSAGTAVQGLVFPAGNGAHRLTAALYKTLGEIAQAAGLGLRVGPQVLRRTFNTLLVESGVNQVVLRSQMGHTSAAMTQRYAGIHIERKQEAVSALIDLTGNGK
jgi:integrase